MTRIQRILSLLAAFLFLLAGCATPMAANSPEAAARWRAGFGSREIAVPEDDRPLYIAGYHNGWQVSEVRDLCRASALWLDAGAGGVLLLSVDCVGLGSDTVTRIREALQPALAGEACSIHVIATHDHAGPDTLGLWGPIGVDGKHPGYMQNLVDACVGAAGDALADRKPGRLYRSDAETRSMLRDSREPFVYDETMHLLRFAPEDGSAGIRLVSYGAHAESLRGNNTRLSRDYPGFLCDRIQSETGDRALFLPGAIGGLVMTREFLQPFDAERNLVTTGERLADFALSAAAERELAPFLDDRSTEFSVPLDNTAFLLYKFLGILGNEPVRSAAEGGETGYALKSLVSLLRIGDTALLLIPGEIFPELVFGGSRETPAHPELENPEPLAAILARHGLDDFFVVGLADDELGYIVTPNDFLTHEKAPYLTNASADYAIRHYEETNSVGPQCAVKLAEALEELLKTIR